MATAAIARRQARRATCSCCCSASAIFLNYVDRGAIGIAAPLMKSRARPFGRSLRIAFSAFFWVYAPVQFFAGWLCDRFSVYKLMAAGILLWAASTLLIGFAGGFASLLVLRVMLGVGESIAFPGSTKIIARHVPAEQRGIANAIVATGIALGPAVGHSRRRPDPCHMGLASDVLRLRRHHSALAAPWQRTVRALSDRRARRRQVLRVPVGR